MTRLFLLLLSLSLLLLPSAHAARTITISAYMGGYINMPFTDQTCDFVLSLYHLKPGEKGTCGNGMKTAVINGDGSTFDVSIPVRWTRPDEVGVYAVGGCREGTYAGMYSFPMQYEDANRELLYKIRTVADLKFSVKGCMVKFASLVTCGATTSGQPSNLVVCQYQFQESGENGFDGAGPDTSAPPYVPPGNGGTTPGTGGGGTDPGTGGTTPGTGSGTDPGTGGGTTPGTGGGTGGTTPGTGGGTGGTTPGTGGGGTGDGGGGKCGAPGQPACIIDEGKTPTGIGGMLDALNKLVDGIGSGRDEGLHSATDDANKDTSLSFGLSLPAGACTDPSVSLPGGGGSWRVDICSYVAMIAPMFEYLWTFLFVYAVMAMVSRATAKPIA